MQDAVTAGLVPKQPFVTRLVAVVEAYLETLDDEDKATAKHNVQRPRQLTRHGSRQLKGTTGPPSRTQQYQRLNTAARPPKMMTMMIGISLVPLGRVASVHRSSKRSFHGCLTELDWGV